MAQCLKPYTLTKKPNEGMKVPCGKCLECLARRISGWSFRLLQEARVSQSAFFITLTYDTDSVPITKNGFITLAKRDVILFIKKLRKRHDKYENKMFQEKMEYTRYPPIKYYLVGEYGEKRRRPHYHAIIFNIRPELMIEDKEYRFAMRYGFDSHRQIDCFQWGDTDRRTGEFTPYGKISLGTVGDDSVGYVLKYMSKRPSVGLHRRDDRVKEFSHMSKGLGISYIRPSTVVWHWNDVYGRYYIPLKDGVKIAIPRYLKDRIYNDYREMVGRAVLDKMVNNKIMDLLSEDIFVTCAKYRKYMAGVSASFERMFTNAVRMRDSF